MSKDWKNLLSLQSPCYGVIVFDLQTIGFTDKCVIVKTHPKKDGKPPNIGFPKGKCEKSKITKVRENVFEGSSRELKEETGIDFSQLSFVDGVHFDEMSDKGNVAITYLVAKFIDMTTSSAHVFDYDKEELSFSGFVLVQDAHKMLWKNRSKILSDAYDVVTNSSTTFTDGVLLLDKYKKATAIAQSTHVLPLNSQSNQSNTTNQRSYDPVKVSKAMSYILRHGAKELGITMDDEARVLVSDLLALPNMAGISVGIIRDIVLSNDKKRFELQTVNSNLMIRAVQGHSEKLAEIINEEKLMDEITVPLNKCIHGTDRKSWKLIEKSGLKPMERMHIHCSISEPEDSQVISGMRNSSGVLIYIDMSKAMADGIKFFMSKNNVILTSGNNGVLEPTYFKEVKFR